MKRHELTVKKLVKAEPGSILFSGEVKDDETGLVINGTGKILKYVVVRGHTYHSWCIYIEDCYLSMTIPEIKSYGNKIMKTTARKFIRAQKDAWDLWRY